MGDFLKYRLPGENVVSQTGHFSEQPDSLEPEGFVVTDFLHQRIYTFTKSNEPAEFHVSDRVPVVISPRDYQIEAQALLNSFPLFEVEKAVLSRIKQVPFSIEQAEQLFEKLLEAYPKAFVYLVSSKCFGTWIGASPEILVDAREDQLFTISLAGTKKSEDKTAWGNKEIHEQRFVSEAIRSVLERNNCTDIEENGPETVVAGPVKHLRTDFRAQMLDIGGWEIAMDLHPTPAVCGTPRMRALDLLESREMHDRFLYTGIIGIHQAKSSRLFVNLRCAQLQEKHAYLYLGGGYTIDSNPLLEWEETENKAQTLLKFMR